MESSRRKAEDASMPGNNGRNVRPRSPKNVKNMTEAQLVPHAKTIQRSWRFSFKYSTTYRIVDDYFKNGPTIEHVKSISFEALVVLLREKPIIAVSKAALQRVHLLSIFMHGSPSKTLAPENVNVRVFLAGYMIAYRPTNVFESMGQLEQSLLEATIPLLETFEKICRAIQGSKHRCFSDISSQLTKDFPAMLFEYLKRFKAWKVPDEAKLSCRIKHALVALYQAEEHLPADEPEDTPLRLEFKEQISRLRNKLQQIAGVAALAEFDEQRRNGGAIVVSEGGSGGGGGVVRSGGGAYAALPGRMTNEQLAHELLLDPTFQLNEGGGCGVENPVFHRIRESFHQAFWDSLVDDLKLASPCFVRVLRVLAEIRDGIDDLAGSRESGNIREAMDLDFIKQQAERGLYGWTSSMRLIAGIVEVIKRVQAPRRDDETKAKWTQLAKQMDSALETPFEQPRAFCKALEFLLDRVNAMRIDAANARLRLIAPVIKDHGIDYERGKLQDKIRDGSLTLERTSEWIDKAVNKAIAMGAVTLQELLDGRSAAFVKVHCVAMLSLVAEDSVIPRAENCPETLLFDVHRLSLLRAELEFIVLAATMLVTAAHHVHSASRTEKAVNADIVGIIGEQFVSESRREIDIGQTVSDLSKTVERANMTEDQLAAFQRALRNSATKTDPVNRLMSNRVYELVHRIVAEGKVPSDIKLISAAKPMIPRIDKAATKLRNLTNLNRTVHTPRYNTMILASAHAAAARLVPVPDPAASAANAAVDLRMDIILCDDDPGQGDNVRDAVNAPVFNVVTGTPNANAAAK